MIGLDKSESVVNIPTHHVGKKRKVQISHPQKNISQTQLQGQQKQSNLYAMPFLNPPSLRLYMDSAFNICIDSLFCMHMSTKQTEGYFYLSSKMIQISYESKKYTFEESTPLIFLVTFFKIIKSIVT